MQRACSRLLAAAWAESFCLICFGQSAPTFTSETSASGPNPSHEYAVAGNAQRYHLRRGH